MFFYTGHVLVEAPQLKEKPRTKILHLANEMKGTAYRYGGNMKSGFDCSGFTQYVYRKALDIELARSSRQQARQGKKVKLKKAQPGDLIFFKSAKQINHVGIIFKKSKGRLLMIHASTSQGVIIEDIASSEYWSQRIDQVRSYL